MYKEIAENFDMSQVEPTHEDIYIYNALEIIVNVTTVNTEAADITLSLLLPITEAYVQARKYYQSYLYILKAVRAINNYVVIKDRQDLTTFVNNVSWDKGCVPYYWGKMSEQVGCDTSRWNICSIS